MTVKELYERLTERIPEELRETEEDRELDRKERRTGTITRWKPDLDVFTDINIPDEYKDCEITILPYLIFEDASGVQQILYCNTSKGTYNQFA